MLSVLVPSVLWRCWLGGMKGIRPVKKTEWWGAGMVICLEWGADLHMAQLMPLPLTVSCFSKIQIGFTFLVPAHPGSLGQRAVKRVCMCVCVCGVMNVYQLSSSGKQLYHACVIMEQNQSTFKFCYRHESAMWFVHGLSQATVTGRWLGETPFV